MANRNLKLSDIKGNDLNPIGFNQIPKLNVIGQSADYFGGAISFTGQVHCITGLWTTHNRDLLPLVSG